MRVIELAAAMASFLRLSTAFPTAFHSNKQYVGMSYSRQWANGYDYSCFRQDQNERADAMVELFRFAWDGYFIYAYPHDDLLPKNNSFSDSRNGWGLLKLDTLDTAIIMEQEDIMNIILDYIPTVDFTKKNGRPPNEISTSLFETNIRYLSGLLSAYDLLKGPFAHLDFSERNVDALLTSANSLADNLKFAFDTPTGVSVNAIYLQNQSFVHQNVAIPNTYYAGLAELGTLCLEW